MSYIEEKSFTPAKQKWSPLNNTNWIKFAKLGFVPLIAFTVGFKSVQVQDGTEQTVKDGITFQCQPEQLDQIENDLKIYFENIGLKSEWYSIQRNELSLNFNLNTNSNDFDTVTLKDRKEYEIQNEYVDMPTKNGSLKKVSTVSKKEIALALMQNGRKTIFKEHNCSSQNFIDHIGIRQNTVLWSQKLEWGWPDGGYAYWNKKYWFRGTPHAFVKMTDAFMDAFMNQKLYGIGCYTATKIVMVHAILDYYNRVSPDQEKLNQVISKLTQQGKIEEPLVDIEPYWTADPTFDKYAPQAPGKILANMYDVKPKNFVPGDWVYMVNTHMGSKDKLGYEGSNAIYLGNGNFDDYYNDHNHSYTYKQKLNEVYQWENGVFSRTRDKDKIKPVSEEDFERFGLHPNDGGYVLDIRMFHWF